jgi:hypothetical protein
MAKKSVAELWNELNSGVRPGVRRQVDKLWNGFSSDSLKPPQAVERPAAFRLVPSFGKKPPGSGAGAVTRPADTGNDQRRPGISFDRALQMLQDPAASTRRIALESLKVRAGCRVVFIAGFGRRLPERPGALPSCRFWPPSQGSQQPSGWTS